MKQASPRAASAGNICVQSARETSRKRVKVASGTSRPTIAASANLRA